MLGRPLPQRPPPLISRVDTTFFADGVWGHGIAVPLHITCRMPDRYFFSENSMDARVVSQSSFIVHVAPA